MSYQQRAKYKSLKRLIYKFQESLKFKTGHITSAGKIVLFWAAIIIFSLFFSWIDSNAGIISGSAFSRVSGKPAIIILFILGMIGFSLFSIEKKEKFQLVSNMYFKDYTSCILGWIFIIIICINSLSFIGALQTFESDIIAGKWPILALCGGVLMTIWGFIMKLESSKNIKWTFINESHSTGSDEPEREKNNMKLPF